MRRADLPAWAAAACALALAAAAPNSAAAAGFDCAKASQPHEKLICATPELSAKDDEATRLYRQALAQLSPEGQAILRDGQRDWLKFIRKICVLPPRPGMKPKSAEDMAACLNDEYDDRVKALGKAAVRLGPFLFSRVDQYGATPTKPEDDLPFPIHFAIRKTGYPRIDQPASPQAERWNAAMAKRAAASDDDAGSDVVTDAEVVFASPGFISVAASSYVYGHGAAHGNTGEERINLFLDSGKTLTAEDLFRPDKPWKDFLAKRAAEGLSRIAAENEVDRRFTPEQTRDIVADPATWGVTPKGLTLLFGQYSVDVFAFGSHDVLVPWADLKPYLRAPMPFPADPAG